VKRAPVRRAGDSFGGARKSCGADPAFSRQRARWVRPENLHVTLKFIGHVDAGKLDAIRGQLSQVRSDSPVEVRFRGTGFFPNEKRPRVFWAGIEASPNLAELAGEIDKRLEPIGVPRETRDFAPHLTLARFEPPGLSDKLRAAIGKPTAPPEMAVPQAREFGALQTKEFHLIESKLRPGGAEYTTLQSFRFTPEG
jgi:RNA 2',3'-cyclic 3'-phosphodiesterase